MPSSQVAQIPAIIQKVMQLNPQRVLDIGVGFGKYGVLCREYLDLWDGRFDYSFKRVIDGVEVFNDYITPIHTYVYNHIYKDDVFKIVNQLTGYDLILIIGTLEHFDKVQGIHLLYSLLETNKGILISTPKVWQAQKEGFGNPYEEHKCAWFANEFKAIGNTEFIDDINSLICYLTKAITS